MKKRAESLITEMDNDQTKKQLKSSKGRQKLDQDLTLMELKFYCGVWQRSINGQNRNGQWPYIKTEL